MPQLYCALRSVPAPFVLRQGGSTASSVQLVAPVTLTWQSGLVETWTPGPHFVVQPAAYYNPAGPNIDTTAYNWLVVAVQGVGPVLVHELGYPAMDIVLAQNLPPGGTTPYWAVLYWIQGTQISPVPQFSSPSALPTPFVPGALLYADPVTLQPIWLGGLGATKGDILRFDGSYWMKYGVAQGNQGDVLTNDRSNSGLPIWAPINAVTPAPSGSTPPGTVVASSNGANTKVLPLWNGSSNNTPPVGWTAVGYDDSAWQTPFAGPRTGGFLMVTGTNFVCPTGTIGSSGVPLAAWPTAAFLLRQHVPVSAPLPAQLILTVSEDNNAVASINGREVYSYNRPPTDISPAHAVTFDSSGLSTIDDNVLCFYILNVDPIPDPVSVYGVSYALSYQ